MPFRQKKIVETPVQTAGNRLTAHPFRMLDNYSPLSAPQVQLFAQLREAVPIIDAAINKLVRLTGGFEVRCGDPDTQALLQSFLSGVSVGGNQSGIWAFVSTYFDQLLTYGTAVGEIVVSGGHIMGLYNAPLNAVELRRSSNGFGIEVCAGGFPPRPVPYPELILFSALNPEPGALSGTSILKGLPFVSKILLNIYHTIGVNWERLGNVRFAVTYKPQNDAADRAYAKERAMQVAKEWGDAMQPGGRVKDFVTVGDVSIKTIGADNQILDSGVPVRQMLEQIVAKTGLPPFMLGLSWSSTERMSSQQADALTSELEAYRKILSPVIGKICRTYLTLSGLTDSFEIAWDDITLQDEVELSRARLYDAQAQRLVTQNTKEEKV
ncbi:MAG: serine/threonine protein phosphatase [Oscillospiraceae bacterium]|nr:serine/threonine protein phosphatase [Oscillospiraceae bacterium]